MRSIAIKGLSDAIQRLQRVYPLAGKGCEVGLKRAGRLVQRESNKEVPWDQGNLRGSSWCEKVSGSGYLAVVGVGYTAEYAIYVHENMEAAHGEEFNKKYAEEIAAGTVKSRGKGQKAKFLEDPVKRLRASDKLLLLVAQAVSENLRKLK